MMQRWLRAAPVALMLAPDPARAHAFGVYDSAYNAFIEGAGVFLASPGLLLPILALAVALGLWREEGLLAVWVPVLLATLAGIALAPYAGPWAALPPLAFGLVVAALAALVPPNRFAPARPVLAVLTALAAMVAALEGHGWSEVAPATRAGLLFGLHAALAAGAGLVRITRTAFPHRATDILWRVVASWLAAILLLFVAFTLRR